WRDDRDRRGRVLRRNGRAAGWSQDDAGTEPDNLLGERRQPLGISVRETVGNVELASFDISVIAHALQKSLDEDPRGFFRAARKPSDERPFRCRLGTRGERPPRRRAAEECDELAPLHSITSLARKRGSYLPSFQISAASFQSLPIFSHT